MTGRQWDTYFKALNPEYRAELLKALQTLDCDPMFKKAYGSDFYELSCLIIQPLNNKEL